MGGANFSPFFASKVLVRYARECQYIAQKSMYIPDIAIETHKKTLTTIKTTVLRSNAANFPTGPARNRNNVDWHACSVCQCHVKRYIPKFFRGMRGQCKQNYTCRFWTLCCVEAILKERSYVTPLIGGNVQCFMPHIWADWWSSRLFKQERFELRGPPHPGRFRTKLSKWWGCGWSFFEMWCVWFWEVGIWVFSRAVVLPDVLFFAAGIAICACDSIFVRCAFSAKYVYTLESISSASCLSHRFVALVY